MSLVTSRSGQRGSYPLPGIPQMASRHLQEPCLPSHSTCCAQVEAPRSLLPINEKHPILSDEVSFFGAGNEARTRYLHLGKVALYQMSYARETRSILTKG